MRRCYFAVLLLAGLLSGCKTRGSEESAFIPTGYSSGEADREDTSKIYVKYDSGYTAFERQAAAVKSLPPITADASQLSPAAVSFPMERTDGDIAALADVNHDGKEERIVFGLEEYADSGTETGFVKVLSGSDENASVLWEEDYGTVHAGWKNFYLYRENDRDYLVRYIPYMNTGLGAFQLYVFSLDEYGEPVMFQSYEADFATTRPNSSKTGFYGDPDKMTEFLKQTDSYLSKSLLLVSTDEGNLAYSTPEEPVTFQSALTFLFGAWDVMGEGNTLESFRLASRKNWLESETIPILCERQRSQNANHLDIHVSRKGAWREKASIDEVMERIFCELEEDNWRYLPEKEMPQETPDVLISISCTPGIDMYISCFAEKELAVIWTAPYVADLDNHVESICECYRLSGDAVEGIMKWEAAKEKGMSEEK